MKLKLNLMLKVITLVLCAAAGCPAPARAVSAVCSLWPVYDFALHVANGTGDDVRLLLPPGTEAHSFNPRPSDIKALNDADIFIYTHPEMEHWAGRISGTLNGTMSVSASDEIISHENDPHVWLDLSKAQSMIRNIASAFIAKCPENEAVYRKNAEEYCAKLATLDEDILAEVDKSENKTLVFVGRFAYRHFLARYGLDYVSAYEGETEPSPRRVAEVTRYITEHGVKIIFRDELPMSPVTREIAEQTGAELRLFHMCHCVTKDELERGATFYDIMKANAEAVIAALRQK